MPGLAEATVFFIVPDVLLSGIALSGTRRRASAAVVAALLGAAVGGAALYLWEDAWPGQAWTIVAQTPGSTPEAFARAERHLRHNGPMAMLVGGVSFLPFKVYAVSAPLAGVSLAAFLAAGTLARAVRFGAVTALAFWLARGPLAKRSPRARLAIHLGVWGSIYAVYFGVVLR